MAPLNQNVSNFVRILSETILEQEVLLGEGQRVGRFARQQLPVGPHLWPTTRATADSPPSYRRQRGAEREARDVSEGGIASG